MAMSEAKVTRGRLLKRAGVGAAAIGAGSMLTAASASADAGPSLECIDVGKCGCAGGCPQCPGGSGCCYCFTTIEGCCFCAEDVFCAGIPTCSSSAGCPPGWACIANTGCGAGGICAPHCGANSHHNVCVAGGAASPFAGGATAAGVGGSGGGGSHHEEAPAHAPAHGGHA
jgi:hypothetical protein